MNLSVKTYSFSLFYFLSIIMCYAQSENQEWKAQIAIGINHPFEDGFVEDFSAKPINFPTVNLGIQHMFKPQLGAKLDFGFNRFSNDDESPEFKTNYTRINAQIVYDPSVAINFLPPRLAIVGHAGPGLSFVKPLGDYPENDISFFNVLAGIEFHYDMSERFSLYTDVSYIHGFGKDFDPVTDGYGSFNGNLLNITFGVSVSLSGCRTCY